MTAGHARPMTPDDYGRGTPLFAGPPAVAGGQDNSFEAMPHPMRDAVLGAVIAATALWVVPRVLQYASDLLAGDDDDEYELELEP